MDKETRLNYGESLMTHAMVFTAFDKEDDAELPSKWRVENSWGRDAADSGYYVRFPANPNRVSSQCSMVSWLRLLAVRGIWSEG